VTAMDKFTIAKLDDNSKWYIRHDDGKYLHSDKTLRDSTYHDQANDWTGYYDTYNDAYNNLYGYCYPTAI